MDGLEVRDKISFKTNGTTSIGNVKFNVGRSTVIVSVSFEGTENEIMLFTYEYYNLEEEEFWYQFTNSYKHCNFARDVRHFYQLNRSELAKKNLRKLKVNHYWYSENGANVLFLWIDVNRLKEFENMTDVEGENMTKIEF